jgi:hypothetical protein
MDICLLQVSHITVDPLEFLEDEKSIPLNSNK